MKTKLNGKLDVRIKNFFSDKFEYEAIFSTDITLPKSAFINLDFIIFYCSVEDYQFINQERQLIKEKYQGVAGIISRARDKYRLI